MVAPQNEFNSAQIFPSCCWTAASLANFIGKYLGPEMQTKGVDIMLGTMERPNERLCDTILTDPNCAKYIKSVGFQWAGKDALPGIYARYPGLVMYQTEQECGNGKNDMKGAVHSWNLMKHYLNNGVSVYTYWNTSLLQGGVSRWGWAQNSLVVVSEDGKSFKYTPEYYVMKHVSHYVMPKAKRIDVSGTYTDALAFVNQDDSVVVVAANQSADDKRVTVIIGRNAYTVMMKAGSINTFFIK
jgi:glucosylceramidase